MQYGVVFPQTEIDSNPVEIRDYAQAAEGMGFDYLLAYDHVLGANPNRPGGWRGPYTYQTPFHEPFVLFGYLAGVTQKLAFASCIIILPQRQTVLVAKQAAEVDILCGGRLRLGVGLGWNEVEYVGLNENFHNRGRRSEEQIHLLRELWTKPLITFEGKYHTIPDAGLNPLPVQRPIPIWFGGMSELALERMARLGNGWMANPVALDRAKEMVDFLRTQLEKAGRKPEDFGINVRVNIASQPRSEWAQFAQAWQALGATHIDFNTMGAGYQSLSQHLDALRQFKDEMGV